MSFYRVRRHGRGLVRASGTGGIAIIRPRSPASPARRLEEIGGAPARAHHGASVGQALRSGNLWKIMLMYHTYCWGSYFYLSWLHTYLAKGPRLHRRRDEDLRHAAVSRRRLRQSWSADRSATCWCERFGLKIGRHSRRRHRVWRCRRCACSARRSRPNKYMAVAFLTFGYFSMDCMLPVSWSICLDVGRKYAGAVTGAMNMAGQIGSFLSSVAFGIIVDVLRRTLRHSADAVRGDARGQRR